MPQISRILSGKDLFNSTKIDNTSPHKSNVSEEKEKKLSQKTDELLTNELYRLSTYKGLIYLLSELERRCDQINEVGDGDIIKTKISVQLLGIQLRLELVQLDPTDLKISTSARDRHLSRLT